MIALLAAPAVLLKVEPFDRYLSCSEGLEGQSSTVNQYGRLLETELLNLRMDSLGSSDQLSSLLYEGSQLKVYDSPTQPFVYGPLRQIKL